MTRLRICTIATAVVALLLAATVSAATPRLSVRPTSVARGGTVTVSGRGCLAGDLVYLISPPLVGHAFVEHSVATRTRYLITARCGGGNLGVSARLRVHRMPA